MDTLYRNDGLVWFQPFFFTANQLVKDGTEITTTIYVDLSWGHRYELRFMNSGFVRRYDDGSQLFRCTLRGPRHLMRLSSGTARWYANRRIALKVFHHTTALAASQIKASRLRASSRNILGDRYTSNYGYAYVTALDRISTVEDLAMIAMADAGIVTYRLDPKPTGGENIVASSIYNQGVADRAAAVSLEVDAAHLVPPYLWRHYGCPTYYEVFQPFNYRIALQPGAELPLQPEQVSPDILKPHGFALVGRTDDPMKILAPLRERDAEVLKVELGDETDLCTFWFEHANTNLYDDKVIELQAFEDTVP